MAKLTMTWIGHLADLRKRMIYVFVVFFMLLILCLAFVSHLYHYFVRPLRVEHLQLIVVSPGEIITVFLSISGVTACGLTLPFILFQVWQFVKPGLTDTERHYSIRLLPIVFVMFLLGIAFAWFVIFPTILHFLIRLATAEGLRVFLRADAYFSFLSGICIPFGFIFELPLVVVFLTRIGLVSPRILRKWRRYAYLFIVVLGVLISPPELISHLSVTVPMVVLYEASILLSTFVMNRQVVRLMSEEQARIQT